MNAEQENNEKENIHALNKIHFCLSQLKNILVDKLAEKNMFLGGIDIEVRRVEMAMNWIFEHSIAIVNAPKNELREANFAD